MMNGLILCSSVFEIAGPWEEWSHARRSLALKLKVKLKARRPRLSSWRNHWRARLDLPNIELHTQARSVSQSSRLCGMRHHCSGRLVVGRPICGRPAAGGVNRDKEMLDSLRGRWCFRWPNQAAKKGEPVSVLHMEWAQRDREEPVCLCGEQQGYGWQARPDKPLLSPDFGGSQRAAGI